MITRYFNNVIATALSAGVSATVVNLPVVLSTGFPAFPFTIAIDKGTSSQEVCLVTALAGSEFVVERGYDNLGHGVVHSAGAIVEMAAVANDFVEANEHGLDITSDHSQYLDSAGVRHDLNSLHQFGVSLATAVPTNSYAGDVATAGSGPVSRADHVHGRDEIVIPLNVGLLFYLVGGEIIDGIRYNYVIPPGVWFPCNGAMVAISDYPELYDVIGQDYAPEYFPGFFFFPDFANYIIRAF